MTRIVVSTPDRARCHPDGHMGPPENPFHIREWTLDELVGLLGMWGFDVVEAGHTRSNSGSDFRGTSLVVIQRKVTA